MSSFVRGPETGPDLELPVCILALTVPLSFVSDMVTETSAQEDKNATHCFSSTDFFRTQVFLITFGIFWFQRRAGGGSH